MLSVVTGLVAAALAAVLLVSTYFVWLTRRIARDAEHAVPPRGRFVTVEGCDIHYVERGEGRPILMIHGLGGTLHHMRRPLMEEFGDGYRLIAGFIDALGLEKPLLVGHSLGGAVALATALA
ncbi:MAG: alpha/beta hydrolase, partial [Aquamicrobium sp.]|nr:alpha/beta hydrolase [Aquamicrobium sp.]